MTSLTCLICLENCNQFITTNYCSCLQHLHQKCFEDWINHNNIVKCIICKKTELENQIKIFKFLNSLNLLFDFIFSKLYFLYITSNCNLLILLFILDIILICTLSSLKNIIKFVYKFKTKFYKNYIIHNHS